MFYPRIKKLPFLLAEKPLKPDVTNTENGERGTGNRERESGNECTAVTRLIIQNGGRRKRRKEVSRL